MDADFFRFPHTPHLAWLGPGSPRDDKVLSPAEAEVLLKHEILVEEKLDGANVGFSLAPDGAVRAQNRGQYLDEPYSGQFSRMTAWLAQHGSALRSALTADTLLFGEWCAARHSLDYIALPDWFLVFDVYDRMAGRFWSNSRRNALAASNGFTVVPQLARGKFSLETLKRLTLSTGSRYRPGPLEGVVVRRESGEWCAARAKLVQPGFTQAIETHWRRRSVEWNRVV
ncbi:MAG: RNA ligase family protein [Xylophilus ampelinus]